MLEYLSLYLASKMNGRRGSLSTPRYPIPMGKPNFGAKYFKVSVLLSRFENLNNCLLPVTFSGWGRGGPSEVSVTLQPCFCFGCHGDKTYLPRSCILWGTCPEAQHRCQEAHCFHLWKLCLMGRGGSGHHPMVGVGTGLNITASGLELEVFIR